MVQRLEDRLPGVPGLPAESAVKAWWPRFGQKPMPQRVSRKPAVEAKIRQGRWVAECPDPDCAGAEMVTFNDSRFFCMSCDNRLVDGDWLGVSFPPAQQQTEIEVLMDRRGLAHIQNWEPNETLEKLREENRQLERAQMASPGVVDLGRL